MTDIDKVLLFVAALAGMAIWSITRVVLALIARVKTPEKPPVEPREREQ